LKREEVYIGKFEVFVRRKMGMGGLIHDLRTFFSHLSLSPLIQELTQFA